MHGKKQGGPGGWAYRHCEARTEVCGRASSHTLLRPYFKSGQNDSRAWLILQQQQQHQSWYLREAILQTPARYQETF